MAVVIRGDTIYQDATVRMPVGIVRRIRMGMQAHVSKQGLTTVAFMPGILRKRQQITTTIHYSPADLAKIIKSKAKTLDLQSGSRAMERAISKMSLEEIHAWVAFALQVASAKE